MSSAFVKEGEYQQLNQIEPDVGALLFYLRKENGGVAVKDLKTYFSQNYGRDVYEMSDGLTYALNDGLQWYIILT